MTTKTAVAAAATEDTVPVEFGGHTYDIPTKLKAKVLRHLDKKEMTLAMDVVLGDEQSETFWERHGDDDVTVVRDFFQAAGEVLGSGNR